MPQAFQPTYKPSGKIIICGRTYDVEHPVVNWYDNPNFSAYREGCYKGKNGGPPDSPYPFAPAAGLGKMVHRYRERRLMGGNRDLRRLAEILRQFVLHHDGCQSSADCFHVLHDERGLSVHFLIDNDGTIYQTLDLADGAFHATGVNEVSIGVELCNRGVVSLDGPEFYRKHFPNNPMVRDRGVEDVLVHNSKYTMWSYTEGQYAAMFALGKALARIFPNLPQVYPEYNGDLIHTWFQEPRGFAGYLGHYHVTNNKWDPGAFDFKRLVQKIKARATWFVNLRAGETPRPLEIVEGPGLEKQEEDLQDNNESESMGGYYPVGPFGDTRLWHGGLHLSLPEGAPVYCPFPGRIVAARNGDDVPIGSRNFVLTRHVVNIGGQQVTFFMLFLHLDKEDPAQQRTQWFTGADKKPFWAAIQADEVAFPDAEIAGGEILGHVGHAGPPGNYEGQVHVEVMAPEELGQKLQPGFWKAVDAGKSGHFCDVPEVLALIDRPKGRGDGMLSRIELRNFFQKDDARAELRQLAVRFQSEWGASPSYEADLLRSRDFAAMPKGARARIYRDQIEPTLWYTDAVAQKVGLPADYIVWHYHPVRFVAWMNEQLKRQSSAVTAVVKISEGPAAATVGDDRDSLEGFTDEEDEMSPERARSLTLEDLAQGFPEERKAQ